MAIYTARDTSAYTIPTTGLVLYVAPNGVDTNTGTSPTSPVKFAKAMSLANTTNTTIVVRGGIYEQEWTVSKPNVKIMAYPGENPLLEGSVLVTGWFAEGEYYVKANYTTKLVNVPASPSLQETTPELPQAIQLQQLWLGDTFLPQVGTLAELVPGKFFWDDTANRLYLKESPGSRPVRAVSRSIGIHAPGKNAQKTDIRGINIIRYANYGIYPDQADDVRVEDCVVSYNSFAGIQLNSNNMIVRNNTIYGNGKANFVKGSYKSNLLIENNLIGEGNKRRFNPKYGAGNMKMINTSNNIIRNNVFEALPTSCGLWFDINCSGNKIYKNTFTKCNIGVFTEISGKNFIGNNLFSECGTGIMSAATDGTEAWGNSFVKCKIDIRVKDDSRVSETGLVWTQKSAVFINNYSEQGINTILDFASYNGVDSITYIAQLRNNQYVKGSTTQKFAIWEGVGNNKAYASLAAFKVDYPNLEAGSSYLTTVPADRLPAVDVPANLLDMFDNVQPTTVGSTLQNTTLIPEAAYIPPSETEYKALVASKDEALAKLEDAQQDVYLYESAIVPGLETNIQTLKDEKAALQTSYDTLQAQKVQLEADLATALADTTNNLYISQLQNEIVLLHQQHDDLVLKIAKVKDMLSQYPVVAAYLSL